MIVKIREPDEYDERKRCPEDADFEFVNEIAENELELYGIIIRQPGRPSCPYNAKGEYVPRGRRR